MKNQADAVHLHLELERQKMKREFSELTADELITELVARQVDGVVLTEALIRLCQIAITVPKKKAPGVRVFVCA